MTCQQVPPASLTWQQRPITTPTFNGSVTIQAYEAGTTNPGSVVATSVELGITNDEAYAFEGFTTGSNTVYMPSAFCNWGPNR